MFIVGTWFKDEIYPLDDRVVNGQPLPSRKYLAQIESIHFVDQGKIAEA
jgi:hypothetical protein